MVLSENRILRHILDSINGCEVGIDEAVVRRKKLRNGEILLDRMSKESQDLIDHVLADALLVVEAIVFRVGRHEVDVVHLEPGKGEFPQELVRLSGIERSRDLGP